LYETDSDDEISSDGTIESSLETTESEKSVITKKKCKRINKTKKNVEMKDLKLNFQNNNQKEVKKPIINQVKT